MCRLYLLLAFSALAGCPADPPPECKVVDTECAPGYVPTFANVYNQDLKEGCGSEKKGCHSAQSKAGGMSFETEDIAYEALLDATKKRVVPGDPSCSEMIVRTNSPGEDYQMPPGDPLSASHQCALIHWVLNGAQR